MSWDVCCRPVGAWLWGHSRRVCVTWAHACRVASLFFFACRILCQVLLRASESLIWILGVGLVAVIDAAVVVGSKALVLAHLHRERSSGPCSLQGCGMA